MLKNRENVLLYSLERTLPEKLSDNANQENVVGILQRAIFAGVRLRSSTTPEEGESLLGNVLASGTGDCVGLTSLYLAIARRFGINMHAAFCQSHVFVFYDWTSGNAAIETTRIGMIAQTNIKAYCDGGGVYFPYRDGKARILNDHEFLGVVLNNRAIYYYAKANDWANTARDLQRAKECFPHHPDIDHNLRCLQMLPRIHDDGDKARHQNGSTSAEPSSAFRLAACSGGTSIWMRRLR